MNYIEHERDFSVYDGVNKIGEITWSNAGNEIMIIDHTFVDMKYRGKKIGEDLVYLVVLKARKDGKKIIPLCPYAKKEFNIKKEYHDVLKI